MSCPSRSRRSNQLVTVSTTAAAAAVGVAQQVWATSSATLRSTWWPMPVNTGRTHNATARATRSWSKAARSALLPPPRANSTTSALAAAESTARAMAAAADWPYTGMSTTTSSKA